MYGGYKKYYYYNSYSYGSTNPEELDEPVIENAETNEETAEPTETESSES